MAIMEDKLLPELYKISPLYKIVFRTGVLDI